MKWDAVYDLDAESVFMKLSIEHDRALYRERMEEIEKNKREFEKLNNK